jgi:hypothetical protein
MPNCKECSQKFEIRDWDRKFYEKIKVPEPKNCPNCRLVRRFMERNPKNLYYRKCDFTGKKILSQYHKNHPFPVYSPDIWWGDDWEALDYGQDFDFSRPFFEQFLELKNKTPHLALFNTAGTIQNSDYNNCTGFLKNCYLIAESDYCEDCYYSNLIKKSNFITDCSVCYESELCYESIDCKNCYNLQYSQDCENCRDSYFLKNCISCNDCIGCINQRQKQYMIKNIQYTKDDYEKMKKQFNLETTSGIKNLRSKCEEFFLTQPHKNLITEQTQNSSGDHLFNSKNAHHCFDSQTLEDCAYCAKLNLGVKESMDYNSWGNNSELMYQSSACGENCYNLKFCTLCLVNVSNCEYCSGCFSSSDCFGCVGMKKQKFCIFNKKYSEEEYHKLKKKIIDHMKETGEYGEFFPVDICPFAYNETMAMDAFPLTKNEAEAKGLGWYEEAREEAKPQTCEIPKSITETNDSITSELLQCDCGKNYKIIPQELVFYKKMKIPIPEKCPLCRHKNRMAKRNPLKLWGRNCEKCQAEIQTTYAPKRPEIIYCEECYRREVY